MFTVANALFLRVLPVRHAEQLIQVTALDASGDDAGVVLPLLELLRAESGLGGVCGFLTPLSAIEIQGAISARSSLVFSEGCFDTLGVQPAIGRLLNRSDDESGAQPAAVLSHDTWMRDFGGRLDVLGQAIRIDGRPTTIVGVTERGFRGLLLGFPVHVVYPMRAFRERVAANGASAAAWLPVTAFARMPPGESIDQATIRLRTMWPRLLEPSVPPGYEGPRRRAYLDQRLSVTSAATGIDYALRPRFSTPVLALLGLSVLLLLISCVNVANLLLLRGVAQRGDVALRVALGAGRGKLIGEDVFELAPLVLMGVAAGVGMAYAADRLLLAFLGTMFVGLDVALTADVPVLAVTAMTAGVVCMTIAGLATWMATRADPRGLLAGAAARVVGQGSRLQGAFVTLQVALALALVSLAALFGTSLGRLRMPVGFDAQQVLSAPLVAVSPTAHAGAAPGVYYRELLEGVSRLPEVRGAALARSAPFFNRPLTGALSTTGTRAEPAEVAVVTEHFFTTLGVPLVSGRSFRQTEPAAGARIEAVISESLARTLSLDHEASHHEVRILLDQKEYAAHIVGVAGDAVIGSAREPNRKVVYLNLWQTPDMARAPALLVRTAGSAITAANAVRGELQQRGREYPARIRTILADRDASLAQEHLLASTAAIFAGLGLLVAAIGLYGVLNFLVASRREELGLRMALGAPRAHVVGLVVGRAIRLMSLGVMLGSPLAYVGTRIVRALVPDVSSFELVPLLIVVASLAGAGVLASWVPAWRAARVDPLEALRGR
jgi:predicted permease